MRTGIKPKKTNTGRIYNEHAKRYVWHPMYALDFVGSQTTSPVYNPKFPRAEIVLVESFGYMIEDPNWDEMSGQGKSLVEKTMGTDAQVKFIMGENRDGWGATGMCYLDSITDIDPNTVMEIEDLIFPDNKPDTLVEMRNYLSSLEVKGDLAEYANKVRLEMLDGVNRAITYSQNYLAEAEGEINNAKVGKLAMKTALSEADKYLYFQIGRALPEDKAGVNMGQELSKALQGLIAPQAPVEDEMERQLEKRELEVLRSQMAEKDAIIKELSGYEDTATEQ